MPPWLDFALSIEYIDIKNPRPNLRAEFRFYFRFLGRTYSRLARGSRGSSLALELSEDDLEQWRGKLRRLCEPKRMSGVIDVPDDIFEQYQSKGQNRRKLLELFIKTDGNKEWFTKHLFEAIRFECIQKGLMDSISRGALFSFLFSSQKTKKGAHYFVYT